MQCKPLHTWPGEHTPGHRRQRSRFESGYSATMDLLNRELGQLNATDVVIELDLTDGDIRQDGWPYASAKVPPPVKLTFSTRKHGALSYNTDRFTHWHDNLRAIALSLEALRKVDRYGVSDAGQQYAGWKALPTAAESADHAFTELAGIAGWRFDEAKQDPAGLVRQAQMRTHPDRGGDADKFNRVQELAEFIA